MKKLKIDVLMRALLFSAMFLTVFITTAEAQSGGPILSRLSVITYPENGENLLSSFYGQITGRHSIIVRNNSGFDAIVKLEDYNSDETYRLVFVRRDQSYTISNVRDGVFMIKFALGSDYSPTQKMFLKPSGFTKFDNPNRFQETRSSDGYRTTVRYSQLSITLAPVVDGNAQTSKISAKDF